MARKRGKRSRPPVLKRAKPKLKPVKKSARAARKHVRTAPVKRPRAPGVKTTVRLVAGGKTRRKRTIKTPIRDTGKSLIVKLPAKAVSSPKAAPVKRQVDCPTCGRSFTPAGLQAHFRAFPGHRPAQTADDAFFAQEMRKAARAGALLGKEVRARVLSDERNPLFRQAKDIGDVVRAVDRTRATAAERKRQRLAAVKAARVGARDAGRTIVFDSSGQRFKSFLDVPKGRKVFVVRPDSLGRLRFLNTIDSKTLMKGVRPQVMPQDPRRFDFRRWAMLAPKEYGRIAAELTGRRPQPVWSGQNVTFSTRIDKGDMDAPSRKIANVFDEAARSQVGITQWVADVLINVKGEKRPIQVTTPVLNAGQFYALDPEGRGGPKAKRGGKALAQSIITYKLRDLVRAELAHRGLVSKASARRVSRMSWNRGKSRKKWTMDPEGAKPWKGAGKSDVQLSELQFRMRKIF